MKKLAVTLVCTLGVMGAGLPADGAQAQTGAVPLLQTQSATPLSQLTVAELAGSWVEPETNSDEYGMKILGSENIVEIRPDGRFNDGLELSFEFEDAPQYDGTYKIKSSGRVSIADGGITWDTQTAEVVPVFPAGTSAERRAEMQDFAKRMADGMIGSETYPMISYDGREMVMDAGAGGISSEYVMTRR